MPIALIYLGQKQSDELKAELAKEAMKILSEVIGKPIQYCSSQVLESVGGFGGNAEPSVFIDMMNLISRRTLSRQKPDRGGDRLLSAASPQ